MKKLVNMNFHYNLYIDGQFVGAFETADEARDYASDNYAGAKVIIVPINIYGYREEE